MKKLPNHWIEVDLEEICLTVETTSPATVENSFIDYIDISSIDNRAFRIKETKRIDWEDAPSRARQKVKPGDTIFSTVRTYLKNIAKIDEGFEFPVASTGFAVIRPTSLVDEDFIFYHLISEEFINKTVEKQTGASYPAIRSSEFFKLPIPLPPLPEQRRIAAKLDLAMERLGAVEAALEEVPGLLEDFRRSVLHWGVTGRLTEGWREENEKVQDAFQFLKRLQVKRREEFQKVTEISKKEGLKKPKDNSRLEFKQHPTIKNWASAKLENLIYIAGRIGWKGLKADEYTKEGPLFLSVYSLNYGEEVNFEVANHISEERYLESPEIMLEEDDILLCKDGAGIGKIGIVKNLPGKATVNSSLLVIRAMEAFVPKFLFYFLSGPALQSIAKERITGSAIPHLFQRDIKEFTLPVPPIAEQNAIIKIIEEHFLKIEKIEEYLQTMKQELHTLRQTLLTRAFRGELLTEAELAEVRAEADYEAAGVLLERIREEKGRRGRYSPASSQRRTSG